MDLRQHRQSLGLSQSKLARISSVSRFKICTFELGGCSLTKDQQSRIREALRTETERLRNLSTNFDFGSSPSHQQEPTNV
jgi:predicted transcriptional regulator